MSSWSFSRKGTVFVLVAIILIGAFLRLHDLGKENLWTDEAFSLHHAQEEDLTSLFEQVAKTEAAPLGYYVLLHYWVKAFGNSEFSVRLPSAIFGVLSILMIFLLTRLFFDRKVALLSSFFLATSMLQVLYSQEARLYSMFTFLTLLSAYFFFKWYLCRNIWGKKIYQAGYFLSILAAVYTNYLAVILIALYSFVLLFNWKGSNTLFKKWVLMHIIVLVLSLPLLSWLLTQYTLLNTGLSNTLISKGVPGILASTGIFLFTIPFILILSGLLGLYLLRNQLKDIFVKVKITDFLFTILFLVFCASYVYLTKNGLYVFGINVIPNPITHSYFLIRHPFFLVSFVYIFIAYKIVYMKAKKLAVLCILLIIIVNSSSLSSYYQTTTKAEWEEVVLHIKSESANPSILVDKGGSSNIFLLEYYSQEPTEIVRLTWSNRTEGRNLKRIDLDVLDGILKQRGDFWLVLARGSDDYYKEYLDERYSLTEEKEFYEISLYHYGHKDQKTNNFI